MRRKLGKKPSSPPAAAAAAVFGDDDLLREILVRLDHPTCLVHAALVSKRWLRHASDPAFLRRFRGLHPPRLLGLYIEDIVETPRLPQFVPLPRPSELDIVFRRSRFEAGANGLQSVVHCRNSRVLAFLCETFRSGVTYGLGVCSPLHPTPDLRVLMQLPPNGPDCNAVDQYEFLPEDGGNGRSWTIVTLLCNGPKVFAQQFVLKGGTWDEVRTSASIEPPASWLSYKDRALLVNGKFYMLGKTGYIIGLDLASMSLFVIKLPDGMQQLEDLETLELSLADDSGFYLIHLKGFQIHVWLHGTDGDNAGEWHLVDTISVCQAIGDIVKPNWESGYIDVYRVGDNAELLLKVQREVFYLHIRSRKVEKVYEMASDDYQPFMVHPFTMVWPPTFPALGDEQVHHGQDE